MSTVANKGYLPNDGYIIPDLPRAEVGPIGPQGIQGLTGISGMIGATGSEGFSYRIVASTPVLTYSTVSGYVPTTVTFSGIRVGSVSGVASYPAMWKMYKDETLTYETPDLTAVYVLTPTTPRPSYYKVEMYTVGSGILTTEAGDYLVTEAGDHLYWDIPVDRLDLVSTVIIPFA